MHSVWSQTYTGKKLDLLNIRHEDIDIVDIAHHLSMLCRYTGAVNEFYSVAQHSVLVSYYCETPYKLEGQMHDAHEAYMNDIAAPYKPLFRDYVMFARLLQTEIDSKFNIKHVAGNNIKEIDKRMALTEAKCFGIDTTDWEYSKRYTPYQRVIIPLSPGKAEKLFIDRFNFLT